jgi:hypothetical protein
MDWLDWLAGLNKQPVVVGVGILFLVGVVVLVAMILACRLFCKLRLWIPNRLIRLIVLTQVSAIMVGWIFWLADGDKLKGVIGEGGFIYGSPRYLLAALVVMGVPILAAFAWIWICDIVLRANHVPGRYGKKADNTGCGT